MKKHIAMFMVPLVLTISAAARAGNTGPELLWGERIWDRQINDSQRIVVDVRGYRPDSPGQTALGRPVYVWRLIPVHGEDGPILFFRSGDFSDVTGLTPEPKPLTVLFTAMAGNDLLTAFNQNWTINKGGVERCWAIRVRRHPNDAGFEMTPGLAPDINGISPQSVVDHAMKQAQISVLPNDGMEFLATHTTGERVRYELTPATFHRKQGDISLHFWRLTDMWDK